MSDRVFSMTATVFIPTSNFDQALDEVE